MHDELIANLFEKVNPYSNYTEDELIELTFKWLEAESYKEDGIIIVNDSAEYRILTELSEWKYKENIIQGNIIDKDERDYKVDLNKIFPERGGVLKSFKFSELDEQIRNNINSNWLDLSDQILSKTINEIMPFLLYELKDKNAINFEDINYLIKFNIITPNIRYQLDSDKISSKSINFLVIILNLPLEKLVEIQAKLNVQD